jgi:hypothetical protein
MQFKYISDSMAVVSLTSLDLRLIRKALKAANNSYYEADLEAAAKRLALDHSVEASLLKSEFDLE